jgi:hypothetical protein
VLAFPFDLRLWTGVDESLIPGTVAYLRFANRRDLIELFNHQLSQSAVRDCRLRIPLTQRLFERLSNTPPWTEIPKGSHLHRLKRDVLILLSNRGEPNLTLRLDVGEVAHLHTWEEPDEFFPASLDAMREDWIEMVGVCAFEDELPAREFTQPLQALGVCIVTSFTEDLEARLSRQPLLEAGNCEEVRVPLLFQTDEWQWQRWLRKYIWKDERLPLAPVGYVPPDGWQPGERPSRYGYRDGLGGVWEWEGGRAQNERNPFGGHWNIQLPDGQTKRQWVTFIEERTGKAIATHPDHISHINVEPDGQIADLTFEWLD